MHDPLLLAVTIAAWAALVLVLLTLATWALLRIARQGPTLMSQLDTIAQDLDSALTGIAAELQQLHADLSAAQGQAVSAAELSKLADLAARAKALAPAPAAPPAPVEPSPAPPAPTA